MKLNKKKATTNVIALFLIYSLILLKEDLQDFQASF